MGSRVIIEVRLRKMMVKVRVSDTVRVRVSIAGRVIIRVKARAHITKGQCYG